MRALLFPGQGSQYVGMGSDFYNKFDLVKKIFKPVDDALGFPLSKLILESSYTSCIYQIPFREARRTQTGRERKRDTLVWPEIIYFMYLSNSLSLTETNPNRM